jgi:hypothetical protein
VLFVPFVFVFFKGGDRKGKPVWVAVHRGLGWELAAVIGPTACRLPACLPACRLRGPVQATYGLV